MMETKVILLLLIASFTGCLLILSLVTLIYWCQKKRESKKLREQLLNSRPQTLGSLRKQKSVEKIIEMFEEEGANSGPKIFDAEWTN